MKKILEWLVGLFVKNTEPKLLSQVCDDDTFKLASNQEIEVVKVREPEAPNIIHNDAVRNKYIAGWINRYRSPDQVTEIVLHGTGGGTTVEGMLSWMYDGQRSQEYLKGEALFHYLIGMKGEIVEVIDPNYYVFHSSSGKYDTKTVGIEMVNSSKSNRDPYTADQYIALQNLMFNYLKIKFKNITRITSHRYNMFVYNTPQWAQQNAKQCPGTGFNWANIDAMLKENNYTFSVDGNLRYNLKFEG